MTRMLVRVTDAEDAALAADADVDVVEFGFAGSDSFDPATAKAVRRSFSGTLRLSLGDGRLRPEHIDALTSVDADEIVFKVDAGALGPDNGATPPNVTTIALLTPDAASLDMVRHVQGRVDAVMLGTNDAGRLIDRAKISELDAFAVSCRASKLPFGLSGGLEAPDVARLLLLEPDVLGFDAAVRKGHRSEAPLDRAAVDAIRGLIPRHGAGPAPLQPRRIEVTDRVFVSDFVVHLAIGAYQAEHGVRQRVRFSVAADIKREPVPPRDMRDIFSYDVMIETIRVLSERPHVTFVETLADEVAASLLAHRDVEAVTIKVEKLDVIDGTVGIEITRRKT